MSVVRELLLIKMLTAGWYLEKMQSYIPAYYVFVCIHKLFTFPVLEFVVADVYKLFKTALTIQYVDSFVFSINVPN